MTEPRDLLRQARESKRLTQEAAARLAGFKGKTGWCNVESGRQDTSVERKLCMARALGCDPLTVFPELRDLLGPGMSGGEHEEGTGSGSPAGGSGSPAAPPAIT